MNRRTSRVLRLQSKRHGDLFVEVDPDDPESCARGVDELRELKTAIALRETSLRLPRAVIIRKKGIMSSDLAKFLIVFAVLSGVIFAIHYFTELRR